MSPPSHVDPGVDPEPADEPVLRRQAQGEPAEILNPQQPAPRRPPPRRPRRSRIRSSWMWGFLAVLGIFLVVWLIVSTRPLGNPGVPEPTPTPTTSAPVEQVTLMIQIRNDSDLGADNMVAGAGGGLPAAQLLVASRLIVDVPGTGQQTLGQSARLLDRSASQDALSDLLALRVDGTLSLARLALAGMVDYVGGITVEVDEPITATDDATGVETVVVAPGTHPLDGTQAAAYALAWLPDEPESARMARFSQVMTATISGLPDDALRIEQMLTSLGASARTTTSTSVVAEFLLAMRHGILASGQQVSVLPTTDIGADDSLAVVRVDLAAADSVVSSLLPQATLTGAEANARVLVQNGVGAPGLGVAARDRLVGVGVVYINGGNAEQLGQDETAVIVADATAGSLALGADVAEALGVPATAVEVAPDGQAVVADAVVVLGADFQP